MVYRLRQAAHMGIFILARGQIEINGLSVSEVHPKGEFGRRCEAP